MEKKVTKEVPDYLGRITPKEITDETLQAEYDAFMAEIITDKMLECGLISSEEHKQISRLNRDKINTFLSEIM